MPLPAAETFLWLGDIWNQAGGRMRRVIAPPLRSIDEAVAELHSGKQHDACGVMTRGAEIGNRLLRNPKGAMGDG